MRNIKRRYEPNLLATLNILGIASLVGFLYCLTVLLHGTYYLDTTSIVLYMVWFCICWLSVTVMKRGDIFGAYALGIATIAVTIYDIVSGFATIGGALLGTIVILIIWDYIRSTSQHDNTMETRLTN
jgi:hypothetical protein